VTLVVGDVGHAADELELRAWTPDRVAVPREQDGRAVVGLENATEVGYEGAVGAGAREVCAAVARRKAPLRAPLGDQEALTLGSVRPLEADLPGLGRGERDRVERLEPHLQLAASPATVAGSPSHDPIGDSDPLGSTAQPKTRRLPASIAYRK